MILRANITGKKHLQLMAAANYSAAILLFTVSFIAFPLHAAEETYKNLNDLLAKQAAANAANAGPPVNPGAPPNFANPNAAPEIPGANPNPVPGADQGVGAVVVSGTPPPPTLATPGGQMGADTTSDQFESRKRPPTLRDQAFKQLLDKISPLTPEQIIEMRKEQDKTQRAVATFPTTPPRPVSSTLTIELSPGFSPPIIRLAAGFVTSVVFVDSTGQSWPISDYSLGNPKNFNIQWDKKTNTLFIQSTTAYTTGNLAIRLATLDTPVMLSLVSGQREVDYRIDLQVNGRGPNALAPIVGDGLPTPPSANLLSVLDGVPPPGSIELEICSGLGRAWIHKGKLIFRTQLTLLSPAWTETVSSPDGTHVYVMTPTPLLLASKNGRTVKIEVKGL